MDLPSVLPPIEAYVINLTWFLGIITELHCMLFTKEHFDVCDEFFHAKHAAEILCDIMCSFYSYIMYL